MIDTDELEDDDPILQKLNLLIDAAIDGNSMPLEDSGPFAGVSFRLDETGRDTLGAGHYGINQFYKGVKVYGLSLKAHRFGDGPSKDPSDADSSDAPYSRSADDFVTGPFAVDIDMEVPPLDSSKISGEIEQAMNYVKTNFGGSNVKFANDYADVVVFPKPTFQQPVLGFEQKFLATTDDYLNMSRPHRMSSPVTGEVFFQYDALTTSDAQALAIGEGPGGNKKSGRYFYGKDQRAKLRLAKSDGKCTYETPNVRTVSLEGKKSEDPKEPFAYDCSESNVFDGDAVNDGYSPINDAHYFADNAFQMFRDWYGEQPLGKKPVDVLVHAPPMDRAVWNGQELVIHDGATFFYPLTSLDLIAHEVGHGVTEKCSNLEYRGQSGGLNEAFSDMTGKAAELYLRGDDGLNWKVGFDIFKEKDKGVRYMNRPSEDKHSIGHISDFREDMDVHFSSGVFNKVFHCLSIPGNSFGPRRAYDMFYVANCHFWRNSHKFKKAAEGSLTAMAMMKKGKFVQGDYGSVDMQDAVDCFKEVGLNCWLRRAPKYKCKVEEKQPR